MLLIGLEFLINVQSHLNGAILLSFNGAIEKAIDQTNYQWLMFYPCIYMFGIWDAYKDADGGEVPYCTLPFVLGAYFGTIGVIYSPTLKILGILLGGVWLGIMGLGAGVCIGQFLRFVLRRGSKR